MSQLEQRASVTLFVASSENALVQMKDGDPFVVAAADAARACHSREKLKEFHGQLDHLIKNVLAQWIAKHRDCVASAHLTTREHDILFVVVQREIAFDQALTDALTELDLQVANSSDLNLIRLEVLAIPAVSEESRKAFLASGAVVNYAK